MRPGGCCMASVSHRLTNRNSDSRTMTTIMTRSKRDDRRAISSRQMSGDSSSNRSSFATLNQLHRLAEVWVILSDGDRSLAGIRRRTKGQRNRQVDSPNVHALRFQTVMVTAPKPLARPKAIAKNSEAESSACGSMLNASPKLQFVGCFCRYGMAKTESGTR